MPTANQTTKAKNLAAKRKLDKAAKDVKAAREAASDLEITTAEEWLADTPSDEAVKLRLPSGKVCLARNPGMEAFLESGMIPNSLMPIVSEGVKSGKGMDAKKTQAVAEDPAVLADVLLLANRVVCHCVIQPEVQMPPDKDTDRKSGVLYADRVVLEDRMFIMQWVVGGTRDLERFRSQSADAVSGVAPVQDVVDET